MSDKIDQLQKAEAFFKDCGGTDVAYLRAHFARLKKTALFALNGISRPLNILDLGAHWLHLAYFFKDSGHTVTCGDVGKTIRHPAVVNAAKSMNFHLMDYKRLDLGDGVRDIPSDSVDLLLFSEIIEHLTFNPLVFWKEVYRILKNSGKLIITTPNSIYYRKLGSTFKDIYDSGRIGCSVNDIFRTGTYGHHWKEYSLPELIDYFRIMDCGFVINRHEIATIGASLQEEKISASEYAIRSFADSPFDFNNVIQKLENDGGFPYGKQIFCEVTLMKNGSGFNLQPPWYVE